MQDLHQKNNYDTLEYSKKNHMNFTEKKKLLRYYLDLSCAFSGMEKTIIFVQFDTLPEEGQIEILEILKQEILHLEHIFTHT
jgi:hypothetical protein